MPAMQYALTKRNESNPKQPNCKKMCVALKKVIVIKEIQDDGQEMAVMVLWTNGKIFNVKNSSEFGAKS